MRNIILTILSILALIVSPLSLASNTSFESQVFHQNEGSVVQLAELSQEEMRETQGAWAHVVYGLISAGRVAYVGVTNNLARRTAQHAATKNFSKVRELGTFSSRTEARIAEQNFINKYNTINNGMNKINSISPKNPLSQRVTIPYRK